ncbi:MAG: glycosyltransferase family 8 protein [Eubacteriales bacterium]|nr:glycosyltransferase family 8 protein [Eubacteriales bacterium]
MTMKTNNYLSSEKMTDNKINILVTFDKNYINPFRVMIKSLAISNPMETFHIWLLHSAIPQEDLFALTEYCSKQKITLTAIEIDRELFKNAPVSKQYPQEMYYRMMAPLMLPNGLERVLYLDPDILVINSIRSLWEMQLENYSFAAASHGFVLDEFIDEVNKARLGTEHDYFNTGVLLIDLKRARTITKAEEIYRCVIDKANQLILPDQDVFNCLYGSYTVQIADEIWNYDARYYSAYLLKSEGKFDLDWVMQNTVFLHFCGKQKPWKKKYSGRFSALYKHYMNLIDM